MYFKLLSSQLNPKCVFKPTLEETTLLKVESDNVTTFTQKLLKLARQKISYSLIHTLTLILVILHPLKLSQACSTPLYTITKSITLIHLWSFSQIKVNFYSLVYLLNLSIPNYTLHESKWHSVGFKLIPLLDSYHSNLGSSWPRLVWEPSLLI